MELLNGTPVFLWRAVCGFALAALVAGILLPGVPAVALVLILITLLLSLWALRIQRAVRRLMGPK